MQQHQITQEFFDGMLEDMYAKREFASAYYSHARIAVLVSLIENNTTTAVATVCKIEDDEAIEFDAAMAAPMTPIEHYRAFNTKELKEILVGLVDRYIEDRADFVDII